MCGEKVNVTRKVILFIDRTKIGLFPLKIMSVILPYILLPFMNFYLSNGTVDTITFQSGSK